ncbi:MAG: Uma2 family endonuclease [Anaerolineae bacterium]|nr:Uma2 family endonuclease [Anaerolineae bacterium]
MMLEQVKQTVTLKDLQRLDAQELWAEVDDGEIITSEHHMTILHVLIIQNLYKLLDAYVSAHHLGIVFIDGVRFLLRGTQEDVARARKPDLAFVRAARIPADLNLNSDFPGAPDLAVEVVSPGQTNAAMLKKIDRYFEAGSEEAWLIYPTQKRLYRYRRDADAPEVYDEDAAMDVAALFPGLMLPMADVFRAEVG